MLINSTKSSKVFPRLELFTSTLDISIKPNTNGETIKSKNNRIYS